MKTGERVSAAKHKRPAVSCAEQSWTNLKLVFLVQKTYEGQAICSVIFVSFSVSFVSGNNNILFISYIT